MVETQVNNVDFVECSGDSRPEQKESHSFLDQKTKG